MVEHRVAQVVDQCFANADDEELLDQSQQHGGNRQGEQVGGERHQQPQILVGQDRVNEMAVEQRRQKPYQRLGCHHQEHQCDAGPVGFGETPNPADGGPVHAA